jgi:hypothetical protein
MSENAIASESISKPAPPAAKPKGSANSPSLLSWIRLQRLNRLRAVDRRSTKLGWPARRRC